MFAVHQEPYPGEARLQQGLPRGTYLRTSIVAEHPSRFQGQTRPYNGNCLNKSDTFKEQISCLAHFVFGPETE
jgi:hypothetical protein